MPFCRRGSGPWSLAADLPARKFKLNDELSYCSSACTYRCWGTFASGGRMPATGRRTVRIGRDCWRSRTFGVGGSLGSCNQFVIGIKLSLHEMHVSKKKRRLTRYGRNWPSRWLRFRTGASRPECSLMQGDWFHLPTAYQTRRPTPRRGCFPSSTNCNSSTHTVLKLARGRDDKYLDSH